nr:fimbrial protein [uncultured Enterobacter sp.]
MKKGFKRSCLAALLPLMCSTMVNAADDAGHDGSIHFTGEITANACKVDVNSVNKEVLLPNVNASVFTAAGVTAGDTSFTLDLTDCVIGDPAPTKVKVRLNGAETAAGSKVLANTGTATNVGVQVADASGAILSLTDAGGWSSDYTLSEPDTSLGFTAKYYSTDAVVGAGTVDAVATFDLQYN